MKCVRLAIVSLAGAIATLTPLTSGAQESLTARVDRVFAAYDRKDSPGCALAVYRDGDIVYSRGYGMANLESGTPITGRTVFDIGSTSKQFTAASIILLAQQGKLSLDDDVRKHIPELPQYGNPITIRHLLHHTSGLRDYIGLMTMGGLTTTEHTTAKHALDAIVRQKALNFEPGAEYLYSNSGYFLLSQIVERVSGKTLRAFAQEQIFAPLGMRATHFHDDIRMPMPERATGYAPAPSGFRVSMSDWEQTGDGAVNTSVEDLLLWDRNFYDPKVGGQTLLTQLHTTGTLNSGRALTYAAGLMVDTYRGVKSVSHGGSWAGYRAELMRFPDQHFSVATLCNVANANPTALARSVAAIYLEDKFAPVPQPVPQPAAQPTTPPTRTVDIAPTHYTPEQLQSYAGEYFSEELNAKYSVAVDKGMLVLMNSRGQRLVLRSDRRQEFAVGAFTVQFSADASGRITGFALGQGRVRGLRFTRVQQ